MNWKEQLQQKIDAIDAAMEHYLPQQAELPPLLYEAMRYSVFAGGKRLRPVLVLAASEAFGGKTEQAMPFACALEMIHTYSLIHDDLPAMDNDDYRRGRLTSHKMYGEAMAILAGDGLLHHAMETMASTLAAEPSANKAKALFAIAHGAGIYGMVAGQAADVHLEGKPISKEVLDYIHIHKTAAMIRGAMSAGAHLGGAKEEDAELFALAGEKAGVAFQILDDILDVTSTEEVLGKPIGSDEKNQKTTYVTLYGIAQSRSIAEHLSQEAIALLQKTAADTAFLEETIRHLSQRNH